MTTYQYRGRDVTENTGRLGLADEPGIYTVSFQGRCEGPREVIERYIDKEIAIQAFRDAHKDLYPWQVQEYGSFVDVPMNQALLRAYEAAEQAFVAVDRPYREQVGR